jgi:hypothetical protein
MAFLWSLSLDDLVEKCGRVGVFIFIMDVIASSLSGGGLPCKKLGLELTI